MLILFNTAVKPVTLWLPAKGTTVDSKITSYSSKYKKSTPKKPHSLHFKKSKHYKLQHVKLRSVILQTSCASKPEIKMDNPGLSKNVV